VACNGNSILWVAMQLKIFECKNEILKLKLHVEQNRIALLCR